MPADIIVGFKQGDVVLWVQQIGRHQAGNTAPHHGDALPLRRFHGPLTARSYTRSGTGLRSRTRPSQDSALSR